MFDLIGLLVLGAFSLGMGFLGIVLASKYILTDDKILDIFDMALTEMTQDIETQKKVYILGGILGQGIKSGLGMGRKGGKFKIEDIVAEGASMFLQKILGGQSQQESQQSADTFK